MKLRTLLGITLAVGLTVLPLSGQQHPAISGAQFDAVSIKANKAGAEGWQFLPDGGFRSVGMPVTVIVRAAAPPNTFDVVGLPEWAKTEGYDIWAKPGPGSVPTREQRTEMVRNLLIERMRFAAHVEEQDRDGFKLVMARNDRRLGPQLMKSRFDCGGADAARCGGGGKMGSGMMQLDGVLLNQLAGSLRGFAGGPVTNQTNLDGWYDVRLQFAPPRLDPTAPPDDAPSIFTAVQEQLGLKLVPEKTKVKIFVVDHIERPTPN